MFRTRNVTAEIFAIFIAIFQQRRIVTFARQQNPAM
jgi:hypothetical protein